jgi:endoglucanase
MNGELSHGLPELVTSANRILRSDTMNPVLLRGVNRSGLEYSEPSPAGFLESAQLTKEEVSEIVSGWHSNIIRLPFNQDWCLAGRGGHAAEEYLASLDQVISWAAALGAYTILDLQWLDADTPYGTIEDETHVRRANHVPPTPNEMTIILWRTLAARYQSEPAVLFDVLNEPHDPLSDDDHPVYLIGTGAQVIASEDRFFRADEWVRWATLLTAEIRKARFNGLLLVGGVDWGFDLSRIRVDTANVVYSAHIYSNRNRDNWSKALGCCNEVPVFIGEWGGKDEDLEFGRTLAAEIRQRGLGWTAWSWVDAPQLVVPPRAPNYDATPFGALVRSELSI